MQPIGPASPVFPPPTQSRAESRNPDPPPPPEAEEQRASFAPNPNLRLDPALGVVVLEFRGVGDHVVRSLPNEQELRAYRDAQRTGGATDKPKPA